MRRAAALLVLAIGLAAATYAHDQTRQQPAGCVAAVCRVKPSWADPLAVLLALAAAAAATAVLNARRIAPPQPKG